MTDQESEKKSSGTKPSGTAKGDTPKKTPSSTNRLAMIVGIMIALVAIIVLNLPKPGKGPGGGGADQQPASTLAEMTAALAATENLETIEAAKLWEKLKLEIPDDPSVLLNRALNAMLTVDRLTDAATNATNTAEEKQAARMDLPDAMELARTTLDDYKKLSGDEITETWLQARIDLHSAQLVPLMEKSLHRELFGRLTQSLEGPLGDDTRAIVLGGPLDELLSKTESPDKVFGAGSAEKAARAFARLSDAHPTNLYLALRALNLNIDIKNDAALIFLDRTAQLAQAVKPTLQALTAPMGFSPDDLTTRIKTALSEKKWEDTIEPKSFWNNILTPLDILKTDRRRVSPHPLDRISFDTIRRLRTEAAESNPIDKATDTPSFDVQTVGENVARVLPIDWDVDLDIDIATVDSDNTLTMWQLDNSDAADKMKWSQAASLDLGFAPTGMMVADLFMVDSSHRERLKTSHTVSGNISGNKAGSETTADLGSTKESDPSKSDGKPLLGFGTRHDVFPSILAWGENGARVISIDARTGTPAEKRLAFAEKESGLESLTDIQAIATGDLEGDGDLDLAVATGSKIRVFVNRGDRSFFETTVITQSFDDGDMPTAMAIADLDRDLDLDIITLHGKSGRVGMLENLLHLQFRTRYLDEVPKTDGAHSVFVEDIDGNVAWDVVVAGDSQSLVAFANTADAGAWTVQRVETGKGMTGPCCVADFDNDSYLELLDAQSMVRMGPWGIAAAETIKTGASSGAAIQACDPNADGLIDVVSLANSQVAVAVNQSGASGRHLSVRFKGIADNAANSGRVNHYAIGSTLELRFGPHYRARVVTSPTTHFGINGVEAADAIRVIMPNGFTQAIPRPESNTIIEEEQSLKGSCPYLYCWDGEKFAFATDCLWAAPLGLQVAPGVVVKDRPWEYLKVDGDLVQPKDGHYELRITEELWEVAYFDHVQLTAVDHPADVDIWTNEKVGPPDLAQPRIYAFSKDDLLPLTAALDTNGRDVTDLLSKTDQQYVQGFDERIRQGLCPPHWVDLDFTGPNFTDTSGQLSTDGERVFLVLRGWILPTDTSLNIQIDQNPGLPSIDFPSLWIPDGEGGWKQAIDSIGFPGGKTKTIVVDVTEAIDREDPRLRIRTSAQIYWDSAALAVQSTSAEFQTHDLEMTDAEVASHGFSKKIQDGPKKPETYDYQTTSTQPRWPPLQGNLTGFGPCESLLRDWDDQMVVISGGDEIRIRFQVPQQPVPDGWKRDFVLHCVGWDKDADLNTLTGQSIGPLPMRDMSSYPPTLKSKEAFDAIERKNASRLNRRQSFRAFWYRPGTDMPPHLPSISK